MICHRKQEEYSRKIKSNTGETFSIDKAIELMKKFNIDKIKAESNKKSDIDAIFCDKITTRSRLGFSIKSQLGGASTLLNTSAHTAMKYKVDGISDISEMYPPAPKFHLGICVPRSILYPTYRKSEIYRQEASESLPPSSYLDYKKTESSIR